MTTGLALVWHGLQDPIIGHFIIAALVVLTMAAVTAVRLCRFAFRSLTKLV